MTQPADSFEHEVRKDRTTLAAAMLLSGFAHEEHGATYKTMKMGEAVEMAIELERMVSKTLDEEQIRNASKK